MSNRLHRPGRLAKLPPVILGPPPPERPEPAPRRGFDWWIIVWAATLWSAEALIAWIVLRR
jgi:hypothetical protein